MRKTTVYDLGNITDSQNSPLLKMWRVDVPAGKRPFQKHQHINFEIMTVNAGSGVYTTEKGKLPLLPGDVFVFSSNEFHCITDVGKEGLTITNLHFDPQYIRGSAADSFSALHTNFCFSHSEHFANRIPATAGFSLCTLLNHIQAELTNQDPEFALSVKSLLHLFLVILIRDFGYAAEDRNINCSQMQNIHRTLSYIDLHFAEKITLQDLADLAGLTPNYYCSLFKQVSGMTLWNYIGAKRIDKAIRLLTDDDVQENMIDIAAECGYNNTANFNKAFKKVTGMTPREYRNSGHVMIS